MNKISKKGLCFVSVQIPQFKYLFVGARPPAVIRNYSKLSWVYNAQLNYPNVHYLVLLIHQSSQWLVKWILCQQHWICWLGTVFSLMLYLSVSSVAVISNNWHFCSAWYASTFIKLKSFISWWLVAPLNNTLVLDSLAKVVSNDFHSVKLFDSPAY